MPHWQFTTIEPGIPERNPKEAEFFKRTSFAEAVVREFIQNSLDARVDSSVSIRFYLGSVNPHLVKEYLEGLNQHLKACGFWIPTNEKFTYLTIEDFGTSGLDGPIEATASEGNFYNFWWREGISQKRGRYGGRWGLGKTTFHIVSKIRTFWGLTARKGEYEELLMGKALLKTHNINGERYHYFGYFSDDDYKPIRDQKIISRFKDLFHIKREPSSPGLSIVVPLPDQEISFESILKAAIQHYFYAILSRTLHIELELNDGKKGEINCDNLIESARSVNWDQMRWKDDDIIKVIEFIKNGLNQDYLHLQIINPEDPEITQHSFGADLQTLQNSFRQGKTIKFKVPVRIRKNSSGKTDTYFTVLIKRFPEFDEAFEFYIRGGMWITETKSLRSQPVAAIFIAEDEPLCEFLGDCETPAHNEWNERTEGLKDKYNNAARTLRFIKNSIRQIVSILDEPSKERQLDFLKQIFSIPVSAMKEDEKRPQVVVPPSIPESESSMQSMYNVSRIIGGFTVTLRSDKTDLEFPFRTTIRIAYDTRRGNPFSHYEAFDFDVGQTPISLYSGDCNILKKDKNVIEMEVTGKNFYLKVAGFDLTRDLVVSIT